LIRIAVTAEALKAVSAMLPGSLGFDEVS